MFEHWQTYGVAVFGLLGLFLTQNAFHAGPLAASQSTLVLVDPLVSICLGIALYGDTLRTSGPYGPLEALSLAGHVRRARSFLSNSPLITGMKSEGKGAEYDEMLSRRLKPGDRAQAVPDGGRHRSSRRLEPRGSRAVRRWRRPARRPAGQGGEVVGMRQVGAVLAPWRSRRRPRPATLRAEPFHAARGGAAPMASAPCRRPRAPSSAVTSKGAPRPGCCAGRPPAPARRPAAPPGPPRSVGPRPPGPPSGQKKRSASSPGSSDRPGVHGRPARLRSRSEPEPGHGRLVGPDGVEGSGSAERGAEHDVAPEAVADGHHRARSGRVPVAAMESRSSTWPSRSTIPPPREPW